MGARREQVSWPLVCWDVWSLTYVNKSSGLRKSLSCPEVAFGTSEWGQGGRVGTACKGKRPGELSGKTISSNSDMAEVKPMFREVLPKQGQLSVEDITTMVLCKPKLLPLKSLTMEKLEKMQQAAQETIRQQEMTKKDQQQMTR
uniref:BBSome interacting protein 1 n=2 Tax=Myotis myotis TaxID=51298 RepID=A0A7J7TSE1_MYOMY|nr:BBSome interacting protein 1 [Myotis myotis]